MLTNTYSHGYVDAIQGRQRVLGSPEYRMGYEEGVETLKRSKRLELIVAGLVAVMLGAVFCVEIAGLARHLV